MKIVIDSTTNSFIAFVEGNPTICGIGLDPITAMGNLICTNRETFNLEIEWTQGATKTNRDQVMESCKQVTEQNPDSN